MRGGKVALAWLHEQRVHNVNSERSLQRPEAVVNKNQDSAGKSSLFQLVCGGGGVQSRVGKCVVVKENGSA